MLSILYGILLTVGMQSRTLPVPSGSALFYDSRGAGALAAFPHAVAGASSCPSIVAARAHALGRVLVSRGEDVAPRLKIDLAHYYYSQTPPSAEGPSTKSFRLKVSYHFPVRPWPALR